MKIPTEEERAEAGVTIATHLAPAIEKIIDELGVPKDAEIELRKQAAVSLLSYAIVEFLDAGYKGSDVKKALALIEDQRKLNAMPANGNGRAR